MHNLDYQLLQSPLHSIERPSAEQRNEISLGKEGYKNMVHIFERERVVGSKNEKRTKRGAVCQDTRNGHTNSGHRCHCMEVSCNDHAS